MHRNIWPVALFSSVVLGLGTAQAATPIFINEIHYDNAGTDSGEFVEIAGPAGTSLNGWSLVLYNGNGGASYDSDAFPVDAIPGTTGSTGFVTISYPSNGLQNGAPDGLALVDSTNNVVQFLSYEGSFTASNGPADGMISSDIGVLEDGSNTLGTSLQLSGTGSVYEDFTWFAPAAETSGAINVGQIITSGGSSAAPALAGTDPANGAMGVPVALSTIVANFTETLDLSQSSANGASITWPAGGAMQSISSAFFSDADTLTITLAEDPPTGETCEVTIPAGSLVDSDGNVNPADLSFNFTVSHWGEDATLISSIQGSGPASPLARQTHNIEAVVIGDYQATDGTGLAGFFVQEDDIDRDGDLTRIFHRPVGRSRNRRSWWSSKAIQSLGGGATRAD